LDKRIALLPPVPMPSDVALEALACNKGSMAAERSRQREARSALETTEIAERV